MRLKTTCPVVNLCCAGVILLGVMTLAGINTSNAVEFTVTNTNDSGAGSLRQAMLDSNSTLGADTIQFQNDLGGTITLATELPIIVQSVTIQGPTAGAVTVSGNDAHRVFFVHAPAETVQINDLSIADGRASGGKGGGGTVPSDPGGSGGGGGGLGGGLLVTAGAVSVSDVAFVDNNATGGAGGEPTAPSWGSCGGGGGLGGDGGEGAGVNGAGGGGIGKTAKGGNSSYTVGQAGGEGLLLTGAQAGSSFDGNLGGIRGGGGGGSSPAGRSAGGGGGDGGQDGGEYHGGDGGFGGGGGGSLSVNSSNGGDGGFGGGGGGGGSNTGNGGGGGFGGGGGGCKTGTGNAGSGGFGGGDGNDQYGGGGLGAGGAIFVRDGASLTISYSKNSVSSGNTVTAGSGGGTAQAGNAIGQSIFLGANTQISVASGQTVTISDSIGGSASGGAETDGGLIKAGAGTLNITGNNSYVGGTTVSAGTLAGNSASLQGSIANNAAVEFNQASDGTYAGNMSGSGTLTKTGAGRLTLSGSNTHSGGTTVSAGTLAANTSNLQGNIANNAAVEFNQAADGTYAGDMAGSGSLTKTGAGRLTLSGSNTHAGGTTVSAGTLAANTSNLQGNITNNATVEFNQAAAGTYAGNMAGSGTLTKTGTGRLTLSGSNTHSGGTIVSAGTLAANTSNLQGNIANNAAVEFNQASDGTFAGQMSGTGSLTKAGVGRLTLSGNSTYSGATSVNSGGLILNGTTVSDFTINTGARLGGNGTVNNLGNSGTVAPGNSIGTTTVSGDYVHNPSATYEVEINNSGQSDLIDISGSATINGGMLDVQPEAGTYTPGSRYTILEADGGVSGTFDTLTGSVIGTRLQLFYNANNIELFLAPLYYATAQTPNQKAVAAVLEQMALSPTGDIGIALNQLDSVVDSPGGEACFDQLGGELFGTTASVGIENTSLFLETISNRLRTMTGFDAAKGRTSASVLASCTFDGINDVVIRGQSPSWLAQTVSCWRPWAQAYGAAANAQGDGNASGLNYGIGGTTVAVDRALDSYTRLGLLGGYGSSNIQVNGPAQRTLVDSSQFAIYLQRHCCCRYWTGIFSYAHNNYDTSRQLSFGNLARTASADYDGNEFAFYLETGRMFRWGALQFQPYGALQYIGLQRSAFSETGATSMNLAVDGSVTNSFRGMLGTRLVFYDRSVQGRVSAPELRAFWRHEFLDEEPFVGASFVGTPGSSFLITGADLGRDAAVIGGGYTVYFSDRLSLYANYDLQLNSTEVAHVGSGGVQFLW